MVLEAPNTEAKMYDKVEVETVTTISPYDEQQHDEDNELYLPENFRKLFPTTKSSTNDGDENDKTDAPPSNSCHEKFLNDLTQTRQQDEVVGSISTPSSIGRKEIVKKTKQTSSCDPPTNTSAQNDTRKNSDQRNDFCIDDKTVKQNAPVLGKHGEEFDKKEILHDKVPKSEIIYPTTSISNDTTRNYSELQQEEDDYYEEMYDIKLEGVLADLPKYIVPRVGRLKILNRKRDELMVQYLKERAALAAKYAAMCDKLFQERADIIIGKKDQEIAQSIVKKLATKTPTEDTSSIKEEKKDDDDYDKARSTEKMKEELGIVANNSSVDESWAKGIPQFWVVAMGHMEIVGSLITEDDVDCLEYLENITCIDDVDGKGFTLKVTKRICLFEP